MQLVYANEHPPESWTSAIFLAGPTPRTDKQTGTATAPSWRPDAIDYLESVGYDGVVFIPEDRHGVMRHSYNDQIQWEEECLNLADIIIFWVPRSLDMLQLDPEGAPERYTLTMPAFTTNAEYGVWISKDPQKVVLGAPKEAPKNTYLRYYAEEHHIPSCTTLKETCSAALTKIGDTSDTLRTSGERHVPLHIWRTPAFKYWYNLMIHSGNRLENARVEWVFRVGKTQEIVFLWALHVDVYIAAEDRHKTNEVIIARPDISAIMLYEPHDDIYQTRIALVKEFRSPVSNTEGYVYELAGGSSWDESQLALDVAVEECDEEVGLRLSPDRFTEHKTRQLTATILTHRAHLFSVKLNTQEMDELEQHQDVVHGIPESSERTTVSVQTYGEIIQQSKVDWAMLGMIASVLQ